MIKKISLLALMLSGLVFIGCSSTPTESETVLEDASPTFGSFGDDAVDFSGDSAIVADSSLNSDSDSGKADSLQTVYFDFNSSRPSSATEETLRANAQYLLDNATVYIQIEGHADERGSAQYNLALGERRANAARDYLMTMGIGAERISTISYGKERPLIFGHDENSWAKNRRANFVITSR